MNVRDTLLIQAADLQDELNHVLHRLAEEAGVDCLNVRGYSLPGSYNTSARVSLQLNFRTAVK